MKKAALVVLIGLTAACSTQQAVEEPPRVVAAPTPTDPRVSEMQVLMTELLDRIEVMNARLQRLENQGGGAVAATPAPATVEPQPKSAPRQQPPVATQPQQRRLTGGAIAEQYRAALEMFGKGRLDDSRGLFQQVFDSEPSGDLADNALYWIAETHFTMGRYNDALNYYQRIITDFSDQNKAPDAMLKSGLAHAKLGDLVLARRTFEQLIARYPYSSPAAAAKYELKRIQY